MRSGSGSAAGRSTRWTVRWPASSCCSRAPSGRAAAERIRPHVADLEADPPAFGIAEGAYDLIVDCFFLHRPLFAAIRRGVRPGGLLVAALHLPAPGAERGHGYVLEPGELEKLVSGWGWTLLHSEERGPGGGGPSDHGLGVAEIVARRPKVGRVNAARRRSRRASWQSAP